MMNQSFAVYSSDCAGAESKKAYLHGQYDESNQSFWSPADQSAFHMQYSQYGNSFSNYSGLEEAEYNYAWSQSQQNGWYHNAQQVSCVAPQCAVNLDDFSDFSDSEEDVPSKTAVKQLLQKSTSSDSVRMDDSTSTDADSTADVSSSTTASDSSDVEPEECASPKAASRVHPRELLLLLRVAVGICADPPAQWSTQPREGSSTSGADCNGNEWRREAAVKQATKTSMKLVTSANSWGAQQIKLARAGPTNNDEEIVRAMKSILNKFTLEKFDVLYAKLLNCGIYNDKHIKLLVHEVFDKACLQHHFVDMYADLCMRLEQWLDNTHTATNSNEFRRILLNQCQESFESSLVTSIDQANDLAADELAEAKARQKQRSLGNVRLIAALLSRGMLAPRVLLSVAQTLSKDPKEAEALESLAVFLTNVGATFDDKEWPHHSLFCGIFDKVQDLSKSKEVAPRIRFLLKDVLDLRATSWSDMKKVTKKNEGPMKLTEVQKKFEREEKAQSQTPRVFKKENDRHLKDLKAACTSKTSSAKTSQVGKKSKIAGEDSTAKKNGSAQKKALASPSSAAKPQYYGSAQPPQLVPAKVQAPAPSPKEVPSANAPFDLRMFRRQLNEILKALGATRDTVSAFKRIGGLQVPLKFQSTEFSNLLTRVAEERCGASRRVMFAFAASLAGKGFDRDRCAEGIKSFFDDVYEDLCEEVPRLPEILKTELVPTMRATIDGAKLNKILPSALR